MITYILRMAQAPDGLRGTIETPGGIRQSFRSAEELVEILEGRLANPDPQAGYGSGSTPSSTMRDT